MTQEERENIGERIEEVGEVFGQLAQNIQDRINDLQIPEDIATIERWEDVPENMREYVASNIHDIVKGGRTYAREKAAAGFHSRARDGYLTAQAAVLALEVLGYRATEERCVPINAQENEAEP